MGQTLEETIAPQTVTFPARRLDEAITRIEKANRRLEREGLTERFTWTTQLTPATRKPTDAEVRLGALPDALIDDSTIELTLSAPRLGHEGWTFSAAIDRVPGSEAIVVRTAPGADLSGWRPTPGLCDHCGHKRRRTTTYIVEGDDGQRLQVGSTCLEAFMGIKPAGLWTLHFDPEDLLPEESEEKAVRGQSVVDVRTFLAQSLAVSQRGASFVTRGQVRYDGGLSTSDQVLDVFYSTSRDRRRVAEREVAEALLSDILDEGLVEEVIAAAAGLDPSGDYGANMQAILSADTCSTKHLGLLASAVAVWRRGQAKAAEAAAREESKAQIKAGFLAEVGTRLRDVPATVVRLQEYTDSFGYQEKTTTYLTLHAAGHEVFWKASKELSVDVGDSVVFTGTVKEHGSFRGVDQTVITRGKVDRA